MYRRLRDYFEAGRDSVHRLLEGYFEKNQQFFLRSEIADTFKKLCEQELMSELKGSPVETIFMTAQEAAAQRPWFCFAVRDRVAHWSYYRIHHDSLNLEELNISQYLNFREGLVNGSSPTGSPWTLEIDLAPFNREFPRLKEEKSIGRGVEFLNRKLSSELFIEEGKGMRLLVGFLRVHQYKGRQLMLNETVQDVNGLRKAIRSADALLAQFPDDAKWADVRIKMKEIGFESGWGRTVARMRDTLSLLTDILEAPEPKMLEEFLGRIPMIFRIVVLSPHGFFSQGNVLGMPDTGGQVVYILDQVRALEREMVKRLEEQGFDVEPEIIVVTRLLPEARGTTCDQRIEKITGTKNARILRVPFRDRNGAVIPHWISRFEIWPYLEKFEEEVAREVSGELMAKPDLIVGNYSDGNLVATMLSQRFGVTQCNIAHALEKAKYLYSDLLWKGYEEKFHFSAQITADLISMNTADFIITSTYQEIAGDRHSLGQYESYQSFTMPGLYRVVSGVDVYDPKFNIVSPGADEDFYFPYYQKKRRLKKVHKDLDKLIFEESTDNCRGRFEHPDRPVLFTMARMDRIKNITGLLETYGKCQRLRELANLFIISGHVDLERSMDDDERDQIYTMHRLMDEYGLDGQVRWLGSQLSKPVSGELYRYIADRRGAFVQPALFEAFGLTVIESMSSGLPTFATQYGGPLEIIKHGVSGFHINPNHPEEAGSVMADFFDRCQREPGYWKTISDGGLERVATRYNWKLYAERMMTLSRVYGFWKYVTDLDRVETHRYLEMLYGLQYRKLVESVPSS